MGSGAALNVIIITPMVCAGAHMSDGIMDIYWPRTVPIELAWLLLIHRACQQAVTGLMWCLKNRAKRRKPRYINDLRGVGQCGMEIARSMTFTSGAR